MKLTFTPILIFLMLFGFSKPIIAQQLIHSGPVVNNYFLLYAGDKIKIKFSGENKKRKVYFRGASQPVNSIEEYWKSVEKLEDIEKKEWQITKDGAHELLVFKGKGEGEYKVFRYPAAGKENMPTTYLPKFSLVYKQVKEVGPVKYYKKYINNNMKMQYGAFVDSDYYAPADFEIKKKLSDFNQAKGVIVADEKKKRMDVNLPLKDSIGYNQVAYGFQKGDTVAFEITYNRIYPVQSNTSKIWVSRPDQYFEFKPDTYGGMQGYLFVTDDTRYGNAVSGSFVVMNDGIFGFYFQEPGDYDIKVVRFPGTNGNKNFTIPIEWNPVYRKDLGIYVLEPKVK